MRQFINKPTFKLDGNKVDFTKYMQDISMANPKRKKLILGLKVCK